MNRYDFPTPRATMAFAALALTACTLGLAVVLPAHVDADSLARRAETATEVAIIPGRIEVIGIRNAEVAALPAADDATACREEG